MNLWQRMQQALGLDLSLEGAMERAMEGTQGDNFYGANGRSWSVGDAPSGSIGTPSHSGETRSPGVPPAFRPTRPDNIATDSRSADSRSANSRSADSRSTDNSSNDHQLNNVIGWPGLMGIPTEFVLLQPRSFAEIPQAVQALRQCKSIVLNLCFLDPDQAQRCADYVAGGTFAIDGYQQRLDETIFLFTPSFVQINHQSPSHLLPDEYVQPPDQPLEKGSVRSSESYQSLRSPTVSLDTYEPLPLAD